MSSVLAKLAVVISGNSVEFLKSMNNTEKKLGSFVNNIEKIAGAFGIAFGVKQVTAFGLEITKLAGQAEAVQIAFDRLPNSIRLMSDLKEATGGTVSELELMKRAVQASNFDISLQALPKLLEFATLRAQQTGQSVDYLVDSIVTGIGRKSKLILDNLGISAEQLKQEFNGASLEAQSVGEVADAVGRIAEKALGNMAGFSENASTKLQRLAASWENLKVSMGEGANGSGFFGNTVTGLNRFIDALSGDELTTGINRLKSGGLEASKALEAFVEAGGKIDLSWQELMERGFFKNESAAKKYEKILAEIQSHHENIASIKSDEQLISEALAHRNKILTESEEARIVTIEKLEDKIKTLNEAYKTGDVTKIAELSRNRELVDSYEKQIEKIKELTKVKVAGTKFTGTFQQGAISTVQPLGLNLGITPEKKDFKFDMNEATKGVQAYVEALSKASEKQKELNTDTLTFGTLISEFVAGSLNSFSEAMFQSISVGESFGKSFLKNISSFMKHFGQQLIAIGTAKLGLDKLFTTGFGGPFAIAAGIALVAAAGAVAKNAASGVQSLSSSGGFRSASSSVGVQTAGGSINVNVTGKIEADGNKMLVIIQNAQHSNLVRKGG